LLVELDAWVEAADPPTLETEDVDFEVDARVVRDIEEFVPAVTVLFEKPVEALVVVALPPTIVADDTDAVVLAEVCTGADGRTKVLRPAACSMDMICGNMVASTAGIPKI